MQELSNLLFINHRAVLTCLIVVLLYIIIAACCGGITLPSCRSWLTAVLVSKFSGLCSGWFLECCMPPCAQMRLHMSQDTDFLDVFAITELLCLQGPRPRNDLADHLSAEAPIISLGEYCSGRNLQFSFIDCRRWSLLSVNSIILCILSYYPLSTTQILLWFMFDCYS